MSIKQKLTWAFAVIAGLPIVLVATLVVINLRGEARDGFLDSSSREIRQVSNAMNIFWQLLARPWRSGSDKPACGFSHWSMHCVKPC